LHIGPFAPFAPVEQSTSGFRPQPAPLFEKEWDFRGFALIAHLACPFDQHWPGARPALPADYHPMNAIQINFTYRPKKRLD
jgi:hypothetical protein